MDYSDDAFQVINDNIFILGWSIPLSQERAWVSQGCVSAKIARSECQLRKGVAGVLCAQLRGSPFPAIGHTVSQARLGAIGCFCKGQQCWGKLLLKVMHYYIVLLPKKVTN